jgi:hypothetical protein
MAYLETKVHVVFVHGQHWSLPWARRTNSPRLSPIYFMSMLLLYSHLRLRLPSVPLTSGFPAKFLHAFITSTLPATCPANRSLFHLFSVYYLFSLCAGLLDAVSRSTASKEYLKCLPAVLRNYGIQITIAQLQQCTHLHFHICNKRTSLF